MDGSMTSSSSKGGPDSTFNDNLIKEVRQNPIIYDFSHPLYGNAVKKQETWNEIAAKLNEKVEAVKTRWRTLRDRYTKERRRVSTCGVGSSFSYYADLCFLDNFYAENRVTPSKRNNSNNTNNNAVHSGAMASLFVKPEVFEQPVIDTVYLFDADVDRFGSEESPEHEEPAPSSSRSRCAKQLPVSKMVNRKTPTPPVNPEPIEIEEAVPSKRTKTDDDSSAGTSSSDTVAKALMRSAEALQRLAERKSIFDRSTAGPRDADECFADFVCMSLKSIDNESRVHARIAILHALAQFQT